MDDGRTAIFWGLVVLWGALFGAAFLGAWATPATGDGFTRGLNKVMVFLSMQAVAGAVAAVVLVVGRRLFERGSFGRRISWLPVGCAGLLVLAIALLLLWATFSKPAAQPPSPPGAVTQPVR